MKEESFADGVLPKIHISGCPSSCGSHQVGAIGFVGQAKKVDGAIRPAYRLFVNGCETEQDAQLGEAKEVMLEDQIPEFLAALGRKIQAESSTFETWYPSHAEEFAALVSEYSN